MRSDRFEYEFGEFIDGQKYEEAETALFELARIAFSAGWEAAKKEQSEAKSSHPD